MMVVADSGSSKTDWLLDGPDGEPAAFMTDGLNPYFLSEKEIVKKLYGQLQGLITRAGSITEIYFFGAGCSSPDRHEIVSNAISVLFPKAFISVDSDLLGSAYATCGHHKGICCVLGTGSNISFFDGENVAEGKHGLGYVLGDEGSGCWLGKQLLTDYLYGIMPPDISQKFRDGFNIDKAYIIDHVYLQPGANSYLASFAKFLGEIRETGYAQNVLATAFQEYIETNIKSYPEHHRYPCHFVGSIAFHFADELQAACRANNIKTGKIIKKPVNDLLEFMRAKSN